MNRQSSRPAARAPRSRARRLFAATLLLAATLLPLRAAHAASLEGAWTVAVESPRGAFLSKLVVSPSDSGLRAKLTSRMGDVEIDAVEEGADGEYSMAYELDRDGRTIPVEMSLRVEGDALRGAVSFAGGAMTADLSGARSGTEEELALRLAHEKPAAAPAASSASNPAAASDSGATSDPGDFAGEWTLTIDSPSGGVQQVEMEIVREDAGAVALLKMPPPLGLQRIENLSRDGANLAMRYAAKFGSQEFKIAVDLALADERLSGTMSDEGGLFSIPILGVRKGEPPAQFDAADGDAGNATGGAASGRRSSRGRDERTANFTLPGDRLVSITYGAPSAADPGFNRIPAFAPQGLVWEMGKGYATRMFTAAPLLAGAVRLEPARYGLWAVATGNGGWELAVNAQPDIWVTQYDPAHDLARLPMEKGTNAEPVETMTIELGEESGSLLLTVRWGEISLRAKFGVAE